MWRMMSFCFTGGAAGDARHFVMAAIRPRAALCVSLGDRKSIVSSRRTPACDPEISRLVNARPPAALPLRESLCAKRAAAVAIGHGVWGRAARTPKRGDMRTANFRKQNRVISPPVASNPHR
jgi:hypothetical protein